jgi:hypothetical protein
MLPLSSSKTDKEYPRADRNENMVLVLLFGMQNTCHGTYMAVPGLFMPSKLHYTSEQQDGVIVEDAEQCMPAQCY